MPYKGIETTDFACQSFGLSQTAKKVYKTTKFAIVKIKLTVSLDLLG